MLALLSARVPSAVLFVLFVAGPSAALARFDLAAAVADAREMIAQWNADDARRAELDARDVVILERIAVKEAVMADLVAGRSTLAAATAAFAVFDGGAAADGVLRHARVRVEPGSPVLARLERERAALGD